jgi:uncharacterized SAM-binding protein YcdF (DUF218 family)
MFRRIAASLLLIWVFGFVWFAVSLPRPLADQRTDAIIVLTGSGGRIERALELLRQGSAPRLLVSGVDREVKPGEFAAEYDVPPRLMDCCITLGYAAFDTRSNGVEAADWVRENKAKSVRLVTADWHMRRAALEIEREMPDSVAIVRDAVRSDPSLPTLFLEYHKFIAREASGLWKRLT